MAIWTPKDLTNYEFVTSQLSAQDRQNALNDLKNNLPSVQSRLAENRAKLDEIQNTLNNPPYNIANVFALRRAAAAAQADPNLTPEQKAEAQKRYEEIYSVRTEANAQADTLLTTIQRSEEYIQTVESGINNLEAAGAQDPGYATFTQEPGSDQEISQPAEVQDDEIPNAIPVNTEDELIDYPDPEAINSADDPFERERLQREQDLLAQEENPDYFNPPDLDGEEDPVAALNEATRLEREQELFRQQLAEEEAAGEQVPRGLSGPLQDVRSEATRQDVSAFQASGDWRVRLKLAPGATYLYKAQDPGILLPLAQSDGVIFPYTPQVQIAYTANYDPQELTHSNYKIFQYRSSAVDQISITCDFTAQDTFEANYLLAVIHFFKSATKMFYGQDENPKPGVPPPLCYLTGLGSFQFDNHPIAITSFNYTLPTDVDYIRASSIASQPGVNLSSYVPRSTTATNSQNRLGSIQPGAQAAPPAFQLLSSKQPTYVPTKMSIQIGAVPIVSRNDISNRFSLKDYATGKLLQGSKYKSGGMW